MISVQRVSLTGTNGVRLDLQTSLVEPGAPIDCSGFGIAGLAEALLDESGGNPSNVPPICIRSDAEFVFFPLQLREQTDYYFDALLPLSLDEARRQRKESPGWPFRSRMRGYAQLDPSSRWSQDGNFSRITGRLNFRARLGLADLGIGGASWQVEVVSLKIGYLEEYKQLLSELAEELVELLLDCESPASSTFKFQDYRKYEYPTLLFHLRRLMSAERLPLAISSIHGCPQTRLISDITIAPTWAGSSSDALVIASELGSLNLVTAGPLSTLFRGFTPTTLPTRDMADTFDTPENRYIKAFLEEFLDTCHLLTERLTQAKKNHVAAEVRSWAESIGECLDWPMWDDVGAMRYMPTNSQVLQRRRGYREILAADLELQFGLSLPWNAVGDIADGLLGDLRPVTLLYEYWCFFVLRTCLRASCGPELVSRSSLFSQGSQGLTINLKRGRASRVRYRFAAQNGVMLEVSLFYNRHFPRPKTSHSWWQGSYSLMFKPDYSILIQKVMQGTSEYHWLHFDAKYKFDRARLSSIALEATDEFERDLFDDGEEAEARTFQQADLWKMHTYRDAIFGSRGAYILYPGAKDVVDIFVRKPGAQYPATDTLFPSVGAFSLRPETVDTQRLQIQTFLKGVLNQIAQSPARYQDELGYGSTSVAKPAEAGPA